MSHYGDTLNHTMEIRPIVPWVDPVSLSSIYTSIIKTHTLTHKSKEDHSLTKQSANKTEPNFLSFLNDPHLLSSKGRCEKRHSSYPNILVRRTVEVSKVL